ncbi:ElyC/SanA/YdcF family protein [Zobellella aerophila]|uniref:Envelope biogenesis factor ElyC n=1 Tax=Zobellella aerophila TaxID=870480 RepID=A0ABP6V8K6_9GAMM
MFLLKKWLGSLLLPLPLLLTLSLIGVIFIMLRRHRRGLVLLLFALLSLTLLSTRPVANALLHPLESRYPPYRAPVDREPPDDIIVLGAAVAADPALPLVSQLSQAGLARIAEGVRLAHLYPRARLILTGYSGGEAMTSAELYGEVAQVLGIAPERLLRLPEPKDTAEEARLVRPLIAGRRAILVTSASHMPRSMALFEAEGVYPVAAPTGHLAKETQAGLPLYSYLPQARYLWRSEQAWHEYLGRAWLRLRDAF